MRLISARHMPGAGAPEDKREGNAAKRLPTLALNPQNQGGFRGALPRTPLNL